MLYTLAFNNVNTNDVFRSNPRNESRIPGVGFCANEPSSVEN
jgi:hypothetical protein